MDLPRNAEGTSPRKKKFKDLNDDYFSILVDESRDVSFKEQMVVVLRHVDKKGSVIERFIDPSGCSM